MALDFVDPDSLVSAPVNLPGSGKNVQVTGWTPPESTKFDTKKSYGTPTKLLENVIQTESSGNPLAVNPTSGAMGVGQFMPETVAMLHKQGVEFNPFNAEESRAAMDYYISQLHKEHGGNYVKAMKAYGGFKTKDPEKYLDKVLQDVDLSEKNPLFVNPESLPGSTNIPESELQAKPNLTPARAAGLFTRGATPAVTGAAIGGTLAGPPGAIAGSMALPAGDVINTGINAVTGGINKYAGTNIPQLQMPSDVAQKWMTQAGLPEAKTGPERMIQTAGSALGGTAGELPAVTRLATTAASPVARNVAETLAANPFKQVAASAPSAVAGQMVYESEKIPAFPVPVLHLHALNDSTVYFFGQHNPKETMYESVDSILKRWSSYYSCKTIPDTIHKEDNYLVKSWSCNNTNIDIILYVMQRGAHQWFTIWR